jgi:hypothetical protein
METTLSTEEFNRVPTAEEKAFLQKNQGGIQSLFMGVPILADVDRIVASADWADGALTVAAQPDVPRNITATLTDADDSVAGVLTIVGKDIRGRTITEVMTVDTGTGKAFVGTKIFASVTSCTISGSSGEEAGVDLITVGVGNVIGTPMDLTATATVHHVYLGGVRIASPTVTTGESLSGIDVSSGTYDGSKLMHAFIDLAPVIP